MVEYLIESFMALIVCLVLVLIFGKIKQFITPYFKNEHDYYKRPTKTARRMFK